MRPGKSVILDNTVPPMVVLWHESSAGENVVVPPVSELLNVGWVNPGYIKVDMPIDDHGMLRLCEQPLPQEAPEVVNLRREVAVSK